MSMRDSVVLVWYDKLEQMEMKEAFIYGIGQRTNKHALLILIVSRAITTELEVSSADRFA